MLSETVYAATPAAFVVALPVAPPVTDGEIVELLVPPPARAAETVETPPSVGPVKTLKLLLASGARPAAWAVIVIAPALLPVTVVLTEPPDAVTVAGSPVTVPAPLWSSVTC